MSNFSEKQLKIKKNAAVIDTIKIQTSIRVHKKDYQTDLSLWYPYNRVFTANQAYPKVIMQADA